MIRMEEEVIESEDDEKSHRNKRIEITNQKEESEFVEEEVIDEVDATQK